jgi:hypothetical protein
MSNTGRNRMRDGQSAFYGNMKNMEKSPSPPGIVAMARLAPLPADAIAQE